MYRRKRSYGGFANALQETDSLLAGPCLTPGLRAGRKRWPLLRCAA